MSRNVRSVSPNGRSVTRNGRSTSRNGDFKCLKEKFIMYYQTIPHGTHVMGYFHLIQHETFFLFSSHFQNNSLSLQASKLLNI